MKNIFIMQSLLSLGNAFVGIFLPFLIMDRFGLSFSQILFLTAGEYFLMAVLVYMFHAIQNISIQQKLALGIFFLFATLVFLSKISLENASPAFLSILIFLHAVSLSFLWPAFHWINITLVNESVRGKFLGNIQAIMMGSLLLGPFLAGLVIDAGWGNYILWFAGSIYFLALVAALHIPVPPEKNPVLKKFPEIFSFFKTQTLEKHFQRASLVEAVQTSCMMLVYPILLKISLKSYAMMGGMFLIMAAVEIVSAKIVGHMTDKYSSKKLMKWGALARFLDIAPRGILAFFPNTFFASVLSVSAGILGPLFGVSFYAQVYIRAEKSPDVYSFIVTREWLLGVARAIFFLVMALGFFTIGIYALAIGLFLAGLLSFFLKKM